MFVLLICYLGSMTNVLKVSMACVSHVGGLLENANAESVQIGVLPSPSVTSTAVDEVVLAAGMFAGIYLTVWEMGNISTFPSDMVDISATPFKVLLKKLYLHE
jgi:hypothetical protein